MDHMEMDVNGVYSIQYINIAKQEFQSVQIIQFQVRLFDIMISAVAHPERRMHCICMCTKGLCCSSQCTHGFTECVGKQASVYYAADTNHHVTACQEILQIFFYHKPYQTKTVNKK